MSKPRPLHSPGAQLPGAVTAMRALLLATVLGATAAPVLAAEPQPSPAEQAQLTFLSQPASWFAQNLKGPAEVIDGQRLDPKVQYMLERSRPAATPEAIRQEQAMFLTPEGRSAIRNGAERRWTFNTKVTAPMASVEDRQIPGRDGHAIRARIYKPVVELADPLPVLVYFHGGGWVFGSVEGSDRVARLIANEAKAIVVSIDYRLAPEHVYPAASDDGEDGFLWVRAHAASLGGDPAMVAVGGDSAGGHVAINVAQRQVMAGKPTPLMALLYYPAADFSMDYPSYARFGVGYGLDKSFAEFVVPTVFGKADVLNDGLISPLRAKSLKGMPATIIATAGFDIIRDPAKAYARRLEAEGVPVTFLLYGSLTHGFLQQSGIVEDADRAAVDSARLFGTAIRSRAVLLRGASQR